MKKFFATALTAGIALVGVAGTAEAYPAGSATLTPSSSTVAPGAPFTMTVQNCLVGTDVDFEFEGAMETVACAIAVAGFRAPAAPASGAASATFTAPTEPGTYQATATVPGEDGSTTLTTDVVVAAAVATTAPATTAPATTAPAATAAPTTVAGQLPETGSSLTSNGLWAGAILLAAGGGILMVARTRRREALSA